MPIGVPGMLGVLTAVLLTALPAVPDEFPESAALSKEEKEYLMSALELKHASYRHLNEYEDWFHEKMKWKASGTGGRRL